MLSSLDALNEQRRAQILEICRSLVQQETLPGQEKPAVDLAAQWMRELGYDSVSIDDCGNAIGILRGSDSGLTMLFDSHVDVVAAQPQGWRFPPFSAEVAEGRVWGRGTTDMKGPLAAAMAGLAYAKQDGRLRGTAIVTASVGEEAIEGLGITDLVTRLRPDLVIICEPSGLELKTAQRGRAEVTITTHGKSAHTSKPHLGVNAARQMAKLLLALDTINPPVDPQLGFGILEPMEIVSEPFPGTSVVPWACRARYDRRLLVGEGEAEVLAPIEAVIARLHAEDNIFGASASIDVGEFVCYTGRVLTQQKLAPAWRMDANSVWVQSAQAALRGAGQAATLGHWSFCTNGSLTAGRMGIPTLGYGPGFEETPHITNEYLDLDQLYAGAAGYYALASLGE